MRLCDYRQLSGPQFDAVASIEMGEHVGQQNYPTYAATLFDRLRPGGRLLLQQMSRAADAAPGGGPFIEAFIAPDMHMRPSTQTADLLRRAGFQLSRTEPMRDHYARTVADRQHRLEQRYPERSS